MRSATVIVPSASATVAIPGTGSTVVAVPSVSVGVAVPGTGSTVVVVPSASAVVQLGSWVAGGALPELLTARLTATPGQTRVTVSVSSWSGGAGRVAYRAVRISDSAVIFTSAFYGDAPNYTGRVSGILLTGLTTGVEYRCEFYLDMTVDVPGYTEQWRATGMTWTQPSALDPAVDMQLSE